MARSEPESQSSGLPDGFVRLADVSPRIIQDVRYHGADNFLGRPVDGYEAPVCLMTRPAAEALAAVDDHMRAQGLALKVFDTYRPARAVADFLMWSAEPDDPAVRALYYPNLSKADLFDLGYVATRSSHSRGSTADLTVVRLDDPADELDFGTRFDFFDPLSHTACPDIIGVPRENRDMLVSVMGAHGFENFAMEWWHFTLRDEPFPARYFDVPVR